MFTNSFGLNSLLKDGGRSFTGVDETTLKNIENCKFLSNIVQSSFGPLCMNKLIVNHLGKSITTSSSDVIVSQLEVQHPAAKIAALSALLQHEEFGDATNYLLILHAQFLHNAKCLLREDLQPSDVIRGYELASKLCFSLFNDLICWKLTDFHNAKEITKAISTCTATKQLLGDINVAELVAQAVCKVMPSDVTKFNSENIRVTKIVGGSSIESHVVSGMVITREPTGYVSSASNTKVMVLACGLEMTGTEAKGTVLLTGASQLLNFTKEEEDRIEELILSISNTGVGVIIVNGAISDTAQHYCNKYNILTLKIPSKYELRRICRTLSATALVRLGPPLADELGFAESISIKEIASNKVTVITTKDSQVSTILIRGATPSVIDEIERAIDDGVNCIKCITKSREFVAGGGASEMEMYHLLMREYEKNSESITDLDRMCLLKFAESFQCIPSILAQNAGLDPTEVLSALVSAHHDGKKNTAVNIRGGGELTTDAPESGILDHHETKLWATKLAVEAALTVLKINQIIMAKPAGGPKPRDNPGFDDD